MHVVDVGNTLRVVVDVGNTLRVVVDVMSMHA